MSFAESEGILSAPEANHAVQGALEKPQHCTAGGISRAILFNLYGHGHFDMPFYMDYRDSKLHDQRHNEKDL